MLLNLIIISIAELLRVYLNERFTNVNHTAPRTARSPQAVISLSILPTITKCNHQLVSRFRHVNIVFNIYSIPTVLPSLL